MNLKGYLYKLLKTPFAMTPQELFELALSYYNGTEDIPQDYLKAYDLFLEAAEAGHVGAQSYLGRMLCMGEGIAQNYDEAIKNLEDELNGIKGDFSVDLDNYVTNDAMAEALKGKANKTHEHNISDIENLQSSLDDKYNKTETYSQSEINDLIDRKADEVHFHNEHYYTKKE
jgi:hypothetical protein